MSYIDIGYNDFLERPTTFVTPGIGEISAQDFSAKVERVESSSLSYQGTLKSLNGYLTIDLKTGTILINDGSTDRILIGYQEGGF